MFRQGEGACDPAVPIDDLTWDPNALVHHALDGGLRLVDVGVGGHEDTSDADEGERQLKIVKHRYLGIHLMTIPIWKA